MSQKLVTMVGRVEGKELRYLGLVQDCRKDQCPLKDYCHFVPKGKCTLVYNFLRSLYTSWTDPEDGLGDVLNQSQADRLGTLLIPLYHRLIKLNMEIYTLPDSTYMDKKGIVRMYPQITALIALIPKINSLIQSIGLDELWEQKFGTKPVKQMPRTPTAREIILEAEQGRGYEAVFGRGGAKGEDS